MKGDKVFDSLGEQPGVDLFGQTPDAPKRPGRNPEFTERRNKKMAARLYYYRTFHPWMKNEIAMKLLMQDFDLSAVRIAEIVAELDAELQHLKSTKPGIEWFWKRWPRMLWSMDRPEMDWSPEEEEQAGNELKS